MAKECVEAWGPSLSAPVADVPPGSSASSDHDMDTAPICSAPSYDYVVPEPIAVTVPASLSTTPAPVANASATVPVSVTTAPIVSVSVSAAVPTVAVVDAIAPATVAVCTAGDVSSKKTMPHHFPKFCRGNYDDSPRSYIRKVIHIVYVIESAAYGVIFASCLCQSPNERGTSE